MLTYDDNPTIRNAIMRRLSQEPGVDIVDIQITNKPDASPPHIQVGVWTLLRDRVDAEGLIDPRSFFDLPAEFSHSHLLNEIDEIAEQIKEIRRKTKMGRLIWNPLAILKRETVKGTGLRGRWPQ